MDTVVPCNEDWQSRIVCGRNNNDCPPRCFFLSRHIVPCTSKHCASLHFWQTAWPDAIGSPILRSDADRPGQGGSKGCPIPSPSGRSPFYNMSCRPRLPHCRCNTVRGVLKRCSGSRISGTGRLRPHIPSVRMPRCPLHRGSRPAGKVSPVRKQEKSATAP